MQKVPVSATCRRVSRKASRECGEEQGEMGCGLQVRPLGNGLAGHTEPDPAILGSHGEF